MSGSPRPARCVVITLDAVIKLTFIAFLSPLWWPVAKALWRDAQDALREEGGIFGRVPTVRELARLEAERGHFESPLVSILRDDARAAAAGRRGARGGPHKPTLARRRGF